MTRENIKAYFAVITYGILLYFGVVYFDRVWSVIKVILNLLSPFLVGAAIAYILNFVVRFFEKRILSFMKKEKQKKIRRYIAIGLTYITAILLGYGFMLILLPQLFESISSLAENFPTYSKSVTNYVLDMMSRYNIEADIKNAISGYTQEFFAKSGEIITGILPNVMEITKNITNMVFNIFVSVAVSVYVLLSAKQLKRQSKVLINAFMPPKWAEKVFELAKVSDKVFSDFIVGRVIDSAIIAVIAFFGLALFKMPYPLLQSVLIGITNIIPVFGPFIGGIIGALIVFMIDPSMTLWYVLFIIVLQQIDGNIIGPKVMGDSLGISGLWVLFAVVIGGGLMGIVGMLLGVPIFCILYYIIRQQAYKRLDRL